MIGSHLLDPEPTEGVAEHVHRECPTMTQPEPSIGPHHQCRHKQVPQQLVKEGGVYHGVVNMISRNAAHRVLYRGARDEPLIELQTPGQRGWATGELLIEVVA